jgi:hypothetical protein
MSQTAGVTIITKWGTKPPTSLEKGELAVDLLGQTLYTSDGNQIIEVGGGTVDWSQINPDTIPDEITAILDGTINLGDLDALSKQNAEAIVQLQSDLLDLAARVTQNEKDISTNAGGIQTNAEDIEDLDKRLKANESLASDNASDILEVETNVSNLDVRVTKNEADILALQGAVDGDLTGLYLGGTYDVPNNAVQDVASGGLNATPPVEAGDKLGKHAIDENKGMYFVCEGSGVLNGLSRESSDGQFAQNGDWLVCDGSHGWILMSFGGDHVAWGSIGGNIENQDDLQDALAVKLEAGDTLDGGRF